MVRNRIQLGRFLRRWRKAEPRSPNDAADAKEIERLNAEYTGSFARNAEHDLLPPRYGRK